MGVLDPRPAALVDRVLDLVRRQLACETAYLAEHVDGQVHPRAVLGAPPAGVASSTEPAVDLAAPAGGTPNLQVPAGLVATRTGGRHLAVPALLPDGALYGVLGALRADAAAPFDDDAHRTLRLLAGLLADDLDDARREEALRRRLQRLLDDGALAMAAQPIVDLASGRCLGVEALARFPAELGNPAEVFAAATRLGLGARLEWLAAFRGLDVLRALCPDQFLTVNLSPAVAAELALRSFPHAHLPWRQLVLEITEHAVVDSYGELRRRLAPLRERGLRVAIDDAGAGYASLHHVVELHPDLIKVDASLVHGLADDHARRVAVSAFVLLALDLGATVVAEGVERPEDLATLLDLGVDAAQGYLLARPSTDLEQVRRWAAGQFPTARAGAPSHPGIPAPRC